MGVVVQVSRRTVLSYAGLAPVVPALLAPASASAAPEIRAVEVNSASGYSNIRALQFLLSAYGLNTPADGAFTSATASAVKSFQIKRNLAATGNADARTMSSMLSGPNVAVGVNWVNPNTVKALEQLLTKVGLTVAVDGRFTAADLVKLRAFQSGHQLPQTQNADHLTWSWLFNPASANIRRGPIVHVPQYSSLPSWSHDCGPACLVMLELRLGMTPGRWTGVAARAGAIKYARRNVLGVSHDRGIGGVNHVDMFVNPMRSALHLNARAATTAQACQAVRDGGVAMITGKLDVANSWQGRRSSNGTTHWVTMVDYNASTGRFAVEDPAWVENKLVWVTSDQLSAYTDAGSAAVTAVSVS